MLLPFLNWTSTLISIRGILTLVDDLMLAFLEMRYMKGRSRTIASCCRSPFHAVGRSHQKWQQCLSCEIVFQYEMYCTCCHEYVTLLSVFDSYSFWSPSMYILCQIIEGAPMFVLTTTVISHSRM